MTSAPKPVRFWVPPNSIVPAPDKVVVVPVLKVLVPPERRSVLPDATFHDCDVPNKVLASMLRFWVAAAMSMPLAPRVSVLPAGMVTRPPGSAMRRPCHERSVPSATELAAVSVRFQRATLSAPGAVPPIQLVPRLRASGLSCLVKRIRLSVMFARLRDEDKPSVTASTVST